MPKCYSSWKYESRISRWSKWKSFSYHSAKLRENICKKGGRCLWEMAARSCTRCFKIYKADKTVYKLHRTWGPIKIFFWKISLLHALYSWWYLLFSAWIRWTGMQTWSIQSIRPTYVRRIGIKNSGKRCSAIWKSI